MNVFSPPTIEEYNYQYYEEYKRLYQTAYYLSLQMKQLTETREDLWGRLSRLEVIFYSTLRKKQKNLRMISGENPPKKRNAQDELRMK